MGGMRLLVVVPSYPSAAHAFAGAFNERCVLSLVELCESVEVIAPRPWVPPLLGRFSSRWKSYAEFPTLEVRSGVRVHRPPCVHVPKLGAASGAIAAPLSSANGPRGACMNKSLSTQFSLSTGRCGRVGVETWPGVGSRRGRLGDGRRRPRAGVLRAGSSAFERH